MQTSQSWRNRQEGTEQEDRWREPDACVHAEEESRPGRSGHRHEGPGGHPQQQSAVLNYD